MNDVFCNGTWANIPATKATDIPTVQDNVITFIFNNWTVRLSFIEHLNRLTLPL